MLTPRQAELAAVAGVQTRLRSLYDGTAGRWGCGERDPAGWSSCVQGAMGEWEVAKALRAWPGPDGDDYYAGDLPAGIEVRTRTLDWYELLLHDTDDDARPFVLVVGIWPRMRIVGWVYGGDGKRPEWWNHKLPVPAYTVPQNVLRPLDELRRP
jgi:hypothetical protein